MNKAVYTKDGSQSGEVNLPDHIFAIEPNEHAMHQAVVTYLAHKRQGTHSTKTRSEVRGGGRKPWRQKGRGTARAGSIRSPLWTGGGTIFGPRPHDYKNKINKKVNRLAKKSALSLRCSEDNLKVVEDFSLEEIKTREMFEILENLELDYEKTLILLPEEDYHVYMSSRNIPGVLVKPAKNITAYDILNHKKLLLLKGAIQKLEELFNGQSKAKAVSGIIESREELEEIQDEMAEKAPADVEEAYAEPVESSEESDLNKPADELHMEIKEEVQESEEVAETEIEDEAVTEAVKTEDMTDEIKDEETEKEKQDSDTETGEDSEEKK